MRQPAAGAGRTSLRLPDFLPYRLSVLSAVVSDGLARTYSERFGFSVAEWRVLATVAEFGSVTAKAIGLHAHMNKVKVSRATASLEAQNYIRREANADDLREAFLTLTDAGKLAHDEISPLAVEYVELLTSDLSKSELQDFDDIVDRLVSRAMRLT